MSRKVKNGVKYLSVFREWKLYITSSLFQVLLIGFLGVFVYYIGGYIIGNIIWGITGNGYYGVVLAPIISAILSYVLYAIGWFIFWHMVNRGGKRERLYTRIFFGWIPLVAYLIYFRPHAPNPLSMQLVSMPNQFIFSTVVTATVLFPLHSIWINRYALVQEIRTLRKATLYTGFLSLILIGGIVYPLAWETMGFIYK